MASGTPLGIQVRIQKGGSRILVTASGPSFQMHRHAKLKNQLHALCIIPKIPIQVPQVQPLPEHVAGKAPNKSSAATVYWKLACASTSSRLRPRMSDGAARICLLICLPAVARKRVLAPEAIGASAPSRAFQR